MQIQNSISEGSKFPFQIGRIYNTNIQNVCKVLGRYMEWFQRYKHAF